MEERRKALRNLLLDYLAWLERGYLNAPGIAWVIPDPDADISAFLAWWYDHNAAVLPDGSILDSGYLPEPRP